MAGNAYWFRDLKNKLVRRVKKLLGRADSSPWVLRPARRDVVEYRVDLMVGLDFIGTSSVLAKMFHEALSPLGLGLQIANEHNVEELIGQAERGANRPRVYLDLCSGRRPRFGELLRVLAEAGVYTIGRPEQLAEWRLKATAHGKLKSAGMPVPPAEIVGAGEAAGELRAGQPMLKWERLGERAGYLRGYNVLGSRTLLWWDPPTQRHELCTWEDVQKYELLGAIDLMDRMARLTEMDFFSSEIAVTSESGGGRFMLVDYCNTQFELNPASADPMGPPDVWTKWVCERLGMFVWRIKHGLGMESGGENFWMGGGASQGAGSASSAA